MGSQISRPSDQQPLLDYTYEEPIIEKISVVLIGHHGVGKNTVGNALLKKEAFKFSDSSKNYYLNAENTTFNRQVSVTHVPGWAEDLNSDKNKQLWQVIKDSVRSVDIGPHAIIFVNKNSEPAQTTKQKLKELLGDDVFQHILIVSVHAGHILIYHNDGKQIIINRCRLHIRCTCGDQNRMLIETIEYFIVGKHDFRFCFKRKNELNFELHRQELANLVDALKRKILVLSTSLESNQHIIERKNAEIWKLERLLKEKEDMLRAKDEDIERLISNQNHTELSVHKKILQLEQAAQKMTEEHERKVAEMQIELEEKHRMIENLNKGIQALKYENENEIFAKRSFITGPRYRGSSAELIPVTSAEDSLSGSEAVQVSVDHRRLEFLKNSRKELTERIVAVMPIADELLQFIGQHKYEKIRQASPEYEQIRQLLDIMYKGGRKVQIEFYKCLLKHEKYLVEELEESL